MDTPINPDKATLADVQNFVEGNIVTADTSVIRCGDGRTTPQQSNGAIRAFGEDYGMMLAIKGALLQHGQQTVDNGELIEAYVDAVKVERGDSPKLFEHTDEHSQEENGIGCGHVRLSSGPENHGEYIVPSEDGADLYKRILESDRLDMQVLQGALLVRAAKNENGKRYSVNSVGVDGKGSYFVVDMDGIREHFEIIIPRIKEKLGVEFDVQEAMDAYEAQQLQSAKVLAISKGPELYEVNIDSSGVATVTQIQV